MDAGMGRVVKYLAGVFRRGAKAGSDSDSQYHDLDCAAWYADA